MWWTLILTSCGSNPGADLVDSQEADATTLLDTAGLTEVDTGAVDDSEIRISSADPCGNPCTFTAEASEGVVAARYEADGWLLGNSSEEDLGLTYDFENPGLREITVYGRDERGIVVAEHTRWITIE